MNSSVCRRLPEVKTLYDILPSGTEGGKEFARIVDLLLFHEARKNDRKITIFNDAAGDYRGLDSFEGDTFRKDGTTGYQYKFYPSPLSNDHRNEIEKSLLKAVKNQRELSLKKWILVTPQDFFESASRKDGGDVTWFESLRKKLAVQFELEHWGHTNLKYLFIETPSICLYYYPNLIDEGITRNKTIQDIRSRYDSALCVMYQNIEFVGMSIYENVAGRKIPFEDIYIPLKVSSIYKSEHENSKKMDPLSLLKLRNKIVILGDPGSGKSTLLKFLALSGISESLQQRYHTQPDKKLPILIVLRRYVDELKRRNNLSLIEYILENIHGDFNQINADINFLEYYLESGQTILLFDGLDELPNSYFKKIIRDRILTLNATYPGNTLVVTSRIVGYDDTFSFDEKEFVHYKLTKLELPEIEKFVRDWYNIRINNDREREANINDLIEILGNKNNRSIRELAENPLLLTIIILVHRIDAVLPDERVILYRKCTETLLNSWNISKYQKFESKTKKGKDERRNLRRIEAIAYWMHGQNNENSENRHVVISYNEIHKFLTDYIRSNEKVYLRNEDAEDLAEEFLEFVKKRAGLLIEIGDNLYGFVHLTFQEYLSASYIINSNEVNGVYGCWDVIKGNCSDAKWNEIIRLLVAKLESEESKELIIKKILSLECEKQKYENVSILLAGLLVDGVESSLFFKKEIFEHLLTSASMTADIKQYKFILSLIDMLLNEDKENEKKLFSAFKSKWGIFNYEMKKSLVLIAFCLNWQVAKDFILSSTFFKEETDSSKFKLFLNLQVTSDDFNVLEREFNLFWSIQDTFSLTSLYCSLISVIGQSLTYSLEPKVVAKRTFEELMIVLSCGIKSEEFLNHIMNTLLVTSEMNSIIKQYKYHDPKKEIDILTNKDILELFGSVLINNLSREFPILDIWEKSIIRKLIRSLYEDQVSDQNFVCNIFEEVSKKWNIYKDLNIDYKDLDSIGCKKSFRTPFVSESQICDNIRWRRCNFDKDLSYENLYPSNTLDDNILKWERFNFDIPPNDTQTYNRKFLNSEDFFDNAVFQSISYCRSIIIDQNSTICFRKGESDYLYWFNYLKYKSIRALEYNYKDRLLMRSIRSNVNFWSVFQSTPELYIPLLDLFCDVFNLKPRTQWLEALRISFLPKVPQKINILNRDTLKAVEIAYEKKNITKTEVYLAASFLILDSWFYIFKHYDAPESSLFAHLVELTRDVDDIEVKVSHCIREFVYGNKNKANELKRITNDNSKEYLSFFESCLWRPSINKKMSLENHFCLREDERN